MGFGSSSSNKPVVMYLFLLVLTTPSLFLMSEGQLMSGRTSGEGTDTLLEIDRLEATLKKMRPPPEIMDNLFEQIKAHCQRKGLPSQDDLVEKTAKCLSTSEMSSEQLTNDIKKAIPEGKLDNVFRDICVEKWPKIHRCLTPVFHLMERCWPLGKNVTRIINKSVEFFCGEENDGGRIALFLAEGGLTCLEKHGDSVKKCVENINNINDVQGEFQGVDLNSLDLDEWEKKLDSRAVEGRRGEVCEKMTTLASCTTTSLRKCADTTPENLITAMLRFAGAEVGCVIPQMERRTSTGGAGMLGGVISPLVWTMILNLLF